MTVHHGLRAAAGNTGSSGGAVYGNPKLNYDWNYQSNYYWTGGSWQIFTHSGTPVTGNGSTGWTNEGVISPSPNVLGHGTSWITVNADLSSHSGKWAMFMYAFNQPSYWQADILFDNIEYEDDGGTLSIPGSANTVAAWQDYWVGYYGAANNLISSVTWPLDSANQSMRYSLGTLATYGKWNLRNSNTPSGSTGNVGTSNGYFVYYEASLNANSYSGGFYNGTNQNSRRILLSKHAYYIGDYSQTPILYTP